MTWLNARLCALSLLGRAGHIWQNVSNILPIMRNIVSYHPPPPGPPQPDNEPVVQQPQRRLPGTGMLMTGLIMIGVSVVGGAIAAIAFAVSMINSFTAFGESTHTISEHVTVDGLGNNQWYLYQDPAAMSAACSVVDEQGNDIVERSSNMEVSNTDLSLQAFQSFRSTADATYDIECSHYPVALGGPVPFGSIIGFVLTFVVAGLLFIAGLVLTIIGAIRRSRAQRNDRPRMDDYHNPPGTPQGYGYPQSPLPPHQSGRYRPHS